MTGDNGPTLRVLLLNAKHQNSVQTVRPHDKYRNGRFLPCLELPQGHCPGHSPRQTPSLKVPSQGLRHGMTPAPAPPSLTALPNMREFRQNAACASYPSGFRQRSGQSRRATGRPRPPLHSRPPAPAARSGRARRGTRPARPLTRG